MIILVDCDNVLIDLNKAWITELNKIYKTTYKPDDVLNWDFSSMFPGTNMEELLKLLYSNSNIWTSIEAIRDSSKYLKKIQDLGHDIYIVTATDYRNLMMKIDYAISKYFPFISIDHIITCYNKQLLKGDYLIDDNINNLYNGSYKKILFTQPYNKNLDISSDIIRVNTWKELYNLFK